MKSTVRRNVAVAGKHVAVAGKRVATALTLLLVALLGTCRSVTAQAYTSIVVFGDSLSDTGNAAALSRAKYGFSAQVPGPLTGYTDGRFTDGMDTLPAARNYNGVWIEQLAAQLTAKPAVTASLNGGRNYAYGFATTNTGTTQFTYGPGNALSFTVNNMGQQVQTYLSTVPAINSNTLFVVWGGANDLLNATTSADITAAATRELALVQRLIAAGATSIIVPNLPPLGLVPRLNGNAAAAVQATAAAQGFNQALAIGLTQLQAGAGSSVRLFPLDIYTLFNTVVGPPLAPGFTNVTGSSQLNSTVNPDTYLFWDDLHPTTYGHSLIAAAALRLLNPAVATSVNLTSSASSINLGTGVTLTASVTAGSGTPVGTVTFLDGGTVLGTRLVSGSTTTATASFTTTTLAAGPHALTASFAGVNGFGSATSSSTTVTVVAPGFVAALSSSSLGINRGGSGFTTLTVTPVGGFMGSFAVACGNVSGIKCSVQTGTLNVSGTAAASTNINIDTANIAANYVPTLPGVPISTRVEYAALGLSLLSGLSLARRRARRLPLLAIAMLLSLGMMLGLSGCGSNANARSSATGTYAVPVTVTPSSGTAQTVTLTVTVL